VQRWQANTSPTVRISTCVVSIAALAFGTSFNRQASRCPILQPTGSGREIARASSRSPSRLLARKHVPPPAVHSHARRKTRLLDPRQPGGAWEQATAMSIAIAAYRAGRFVQEKGERHLESLVVRIRVPCPRTRCPKRPLRSVLSCSTSDQRFERSCAFFPLADRK
jgi:hypothetical protein